MQVARNFLRHMLLHIYAEKVELSKFLTTNHSQMIDLSSYLKKNHKNQIISVTQKTVSLERKEIFSYLSNVIPFIHFETANYF